MLEFPKPRPLVCSYCHAGPKDGAGRTLSAEAGLLTVTWHTASCPHYAADRILADKRN
ncbi:hypothetical protein AB0I68_11235 [Streptomyces sp. NPDC050448]|uniref:hypothetical protein n=1 Tax=Streptomyces sp. NPDC050448 TaxID=3155404 RepID=UPI00341A61C3